MSKSKKIAMIVAVICIAFGIIVSFAAFITMGFDFSKINMMEDFEMKIYEISEDFDNIKIHEIECDVYLLPSDNGKCRVESTENDKIINIVEVKNGTLEITRKDVRPWYEHIGIWWGNDFSLTVYLPKNEYRNLYLKTVSGNISVPDNFNFSSAETISTSGDISFCGKVTNGFSAKSTSGVLNLKNVNGGAAEAVTTSGDIFLENINADSLLVKTTSGRFDVSDIKINGSAEFYSVSGNMKMNYADASSFIIKTTSGDVFCDILSRKNFKTQTTSGDIRVPESDFSAGFFDVKTTSGDITVNIINN